MTLTEAERRIADDAERHKGEPSLPVPILLYISTILMLSAGVLGLWERKTAPQYLLLIGFAILFFGFFKMQARYRTALSLISKLQGEQLSPEI